MVALRIFYITISIICVLSLGGVVYTFHTISSTNLVIRKLELVLSDIRVSSSNTFPPITDPVVPIPDTIEFSLVEDSSSPQDNTSTLSLKVHLTVPFTSQAPEKNWDQPWQDACEEAAILMLDAYYKGYNLSPLFARDELLKQVAWQETKGWGGSIDIANVRTAAAWYMQIPESQFTIHRNPTVELIKTKLANGHPILAVVDGTVLPNPYFSGDGPVYHALVIIGYDDATREFITNDPGTQFGKNFRYPYDDLMRALRDWNNGDVKNGVPVVLVKK
jgi:hypothetical protein